MRRQSLLTPPLASVRARKGGIKPGPEALQTPWVQREPEGMIQCVWRPSLKHTPGLDLYTWMENLPREQYRELKVFLSGIKRENYFRFKSQSGSKKKSCLLLSAVQSSLLADWSSPNMRVCMCVCVPLLAPVCRPSASPGLDSCRLRSEGPLNLGGYSFAHICYEFTRAKPFKGSFMEPSGALWLLAIKTHTRLIHIHIFAHTCGRMEHAQVSIHAHIYTHAYI